MDEKGRILLGRMMALCSKREYCEADIRSRLSKAVKDDMEIAADAASWAQEADEIIDLLKKEKFIDDFRYAKAYVRDKSAISGWGRVKIRHGLAARGVSKEAVAEALSEMEGNPGMARLEKALRSKAVVLKDDPQCRYKLLRFALGRGYEYEEIRGLVDDVLKNPE